MSSDDKTSIDVDAVHEAGKNAEDFADTVSNLGSYLGKQLVDPKAFGTSDVGQAAARLVASPLNGSSQMLGKSLGKYLSGISQRLEAVTKSTTATEQKNAFQLGSIDEG